MSKQVIFRRLAATNLRTGDIVKLTDAGIALNRKPNAKNPCTPESLVCTRGARQGEVCEYVINGPMP